ncbi:MAG: long-chain fatty acid--CoA ligase [Betaproteobacteria bacterium]|nr:long-chain fatty acid--CoA ligase [Betaproteobacteria bacterium]
MPEALSTAEAALPAAAAARLPAALKKPLEVLRLYPAHDYTVAGAFASRLGAHADKAFYIHNGKSRSWREFDADVARCAALLASRGVKAGERIGIVARNSPAHVLLLFALARLAAVMVPVNPEFGVTEAGYVLEHAQLSGLACDAAALATVRAACAERKLAPWMLLLDAPLADVVDAPPLLSDVMAQGEGQPVPPARGKADDTVVIIYTSGTTGFPKGAMHSQKSFVLGGEAFVERMYVQPEDRLMIVLPMFHMNALFYSVAGTLAAGASMAIVPRFSASAFWAQAAASGATVVNIIEAACNILKARPRSEFDAAHRLRCAYGVRHSAWQAFREEFGIPYFVSGYGMTEIPGVTCSPYEGLQKPGTMGPVGRHPDPAVPWAQCRVVDDAGNDVADGVAGEMIVRTPLVTQGYFRDAEQTAAAFRDGWFLTGDLVSRDADGYYTFVSRKKDIIRRRGENIAGAELDRVIGQHPDVAEAAAIPVPAELGEDEILAVVVAKPGATLTARDIADWCAKHLAPMKVPRYVLFVENLPHTPTQKVQKNLLRADATLKDRATDLSKA